MEVSTTGFQMMKLGNLKDTMKEGFPKSLDGRLMDAYEELNSSASASASAPASRVAGIAYKEQQDFNVKHNGGSMIPTHSKIGQGK